MAADLLLTNGIVRTMDAARTVGEAVAVKQGRILAVGDNSTVTGYGSSGTRVVDLGGKTLLPGFIDAHQHLMYLGLSLQQVDASPQAVSSIDEIVRQVQVRAESLPPGHWIEGRGYNDARLLERRNLTRHDLDAASRAHPVFITRACGHVMTLNSRALELAGIERATPDPPGGKIDRHPETGEPTGVLRETAMTLLRRVAPQPSESSLRQAILDGAAANLKQGITSVWEPSIEPNHLRVYRKMDTQSELPLRVTMAHKKVLRSGEEVPLPEPFRGPMLSLVAIKLFQDGGFGAATAALSTPYSNEPASTGLLTWPQDQLNDWARAIHDKGLRISIHAIGDRAITSALDAIEYALNGSPVSDHRHRIEHCGLPLPPLPERLATLKVVPVLQPPFLWFDGGVYVDRVGAERADWLYPVKALLEHGVNVAGSSDGPVVPNISPLLGAYVAVVRKSHDDRKVGSGQAVGVESALSLYTSRAAYALGEERVKGSIEPGKVADFAILPVDPVAVPVEELPQIPVETVYVGGRERSLD